MTNTDSRLQMIRDRLQQAFNPTHLEIIDDSAKHVGHVGSQGGAGHYTVIIGSDQFKNQSRISVHRQIYAVLNDMIPHEIHALQIQLTS